VKEQRPGTGHVFLSAGVQHEVRAAGPVMVRKVIAPQPEPIAGIKSAFTAALSEVGIGDFRLNAKNIKGGFMVSKILVPTDGSKTALKAVTYAVDLAKQLNASIIVLSVIDNRSFIAQTVSAVDTPTHVIEPIADYLRDAAKGYAGEVEKLCDKSGVQSETVIATGHPVENIVKEAKKSKVDLIVIGSHGISALAASVLGSVAYGVIHNQTKVPVLIVR